jgi:hypothetical protein
MEAIGRKAALQIGVHAVIAFEVVTPAFKFQHLLKQVDDRRLIELVYRSGFDERLAEFMLAPSIQQRSLALARRGSPSRRGNSPALGRFNVS